MLPAIIIIAFIIILCQFLPKPAFAHGLGGKLFSAFVEDKEFRLWVEASPIIITKETRDNSSMLFRFYDPTTSQNLKFVTFSLSLSHDGRLLISDKFLASNGAVVLRFHPNESDEVVSIDGNRDSLYDAWLVENNPPVVDVRGPIFLEGGLYYIQIDVLGLGTPDHSLAPRDVVHFDYHLGVGYPDSKEVTYNGQNYNITIVSYFDKVTGVNFDPDKTMVTWSMPFEYNMSHIMNESDAYMHQEVRVPKSFQEFANFTLMTPTVNGEIMTGNFVFDPYSLQSENTIHYIITKNNIVRFSEAYLNNSSTGQYQQGSMIFTLAPSNSNNTETTSLIFSDTGYFKVLPSWSPSMLNPDSESELDLVFIDTSTGDYENIDMKYDLSIIDEDLTVVQKKTDLIAKDGRDTQMISFPANGVYQVQVKVTELVGLESTALSARTRLGTATGYVVVPEFPLELTGIIVASIIVPILIIGRKSSLLGYRK